jgi:hypothetical protein
LSRTLTFRARSAFLWIAWKSFGDDSPDDARPTHQKSLDRGYMEVLMTAI